MSDVNFIFFLSLIIIALGYIVKRLNIITEENGKIVAKVIFNITLPAVIINVVSIIEFSVSLILLPLINVLFGLGMFAIGLIIFKKHPRKIKGLVLMTLIGFNVVHFSFPLVEGIWGENGMQYIAFFDMGNTFTIFVVCYLVGSVFSSNVDTDQIHIDIKYLAKSLLKSAPLLSYIFALILNISGVILPLFFTDLISILARANTALSLLLLGIYLNFKFERAEWDIILKVLFVRYSIGLFIGILLFFFLPFDQFTHLFRIIIVISLILPVGLAVIPFSVEFEYDQKLTSIIVNLTIIVSFILIWILIIFLDG